MTEPPPPTTLTQANLTPAELAERKADVVRRKDSGEGFADIGKVWGISKQRAHQLYWETVAEVPALAVTEMRAQQNARLDALLRRLEDIADRQHVVVSGGEIVRDQDGKPLRDSGPELTALRELRATLWEQARLNGTMAPAQVTVNGTISYDVTGIDLKELQ